MKRLKLLEKNSSYWLIFCLLVGFFLLRFPSLFEPHWYGDEGIYQVIGDALNSGRMLYQGIWDNKPPLLYVLYAAMQSNQFAVRLLSLLFGLAATGAFFFLAKSLLKDTKSVVLALVPFVLLFATPFLEGNIANAENFMLLPVITAGFLVLRFTLVKKQSTLFWSGILLSLAFLTKIVGLFDFAAFALFLVLLDPKQSVVKRIKGIAPMLWGFALPIGFVFLFFMLRGTLAPFITSVFLQNVTYVNHGNAFIIPQGLLIFKSLLLGGAVGFLFWKRKILSPETLFILLWFVFSLFNALFSQRPYTHYLLVLLPSFCLLVGLVAKQKERLLPLLMLALIILSLHNMFSLGRFQKTFKYYQTFTSYLMGNMTVAAYQNFFDRNTPRDYALAQYITMHTTPSDTLFVWGNNASLYTLAHKLPPGRYIVAYHILSSKEAIVETYNDLRLVKPRYIVVMPNVPQMPYALSGYQQKIILDNAQIYERIY